jgi:hypothetical protein
MEAAMAKNRKSNIDQPDMPNDLRRRDQPTADAPAMVPHPNEEVGIDGVSPSEDGGVDQHPIHDGDLEDLGPEDYEEMTNEVAKVGIKPERR